MLKRFISTIASVSLLTAFITVMPMPAPEAEAATPGSAFDPGLIISDSVFYDFGTMTVSDIQKFLDSRVENCRADADGPPCLKDFVADTQAIDAIVGRCSAIPARSQATAAQIIFDVANACGINPEVLIVTLQKEQGLVTSTRPTAYMYRAAMGYGCPDSDPGICGKVYVGLFNQIYRAGSQLQWYGNSEGSFTWLRPGRTVNVRYNPKSSCGTLAFELKSQATANLYYYTPYTPNKSALDNLYGSGDSCSAYGNRNFWRFFHDWFGSPVGGGYLLQSSGSELFVISGSKKHAVTDSSMVAALSALGPTGVISQPYLDSFETAEPMQLIARSGSSGELYLLAGDARYLISDASLATQFGLDANLAIELPSAQLLAFTDAGPLTRLLQDVQGDKFWVENGQYRKVLDDLALNTLGVSIPVVTALKPTAVPSISQGAPLASDLKVFGIEGSTQLGLSSEGKIYVFSESLAKELTLDIWFEKVPGSVSIESLGANLVSVEPFSVSGSGVGYLLSANGKVELENVTDWYPNPSELSDAILNKIPDAQAKPLPTPVVLGFAGSKYGYLVDGGVRRTSLEPTTTAELLKLIGQEKVFASTRETVFAIEAAGITAVPGSAVFGTTSKNYYLIDGFASKIWLSSAKHAKSTSGGIDAKITDSLLKTLKTTATLSSPKVLCGGVEYLLDNGTLNAVSPALAAEFPQTATELKNSTCKALGVSQEPMQQFIRAENRTVWVVLDGKRYNFKSWADFQSGAGEDAKFTWVSDWFLYSIPSGGKVAQEIELVAPAAAPSGDFGQIESTEVDPEIAAEDSAEVEPEPKQPEPDQTGSSQPVSLEPKYLDHRVSAGDYLGKIAASYATTVSAIVSANSLANANRIRVGQVLRVPNPDYVAGAATSPAPSPAPTPESTPESTPVPDAPAQPRYLDYRVSSGDYLGKIASKFSVSVASIVKANSLANANRINIGQMLKIPNVLYSGGTQTSVASESEGQESGTAQSSSDQGVAAPELVTTTTYRVSSGDTLLKVAAKFGTTTSKLVTLNELPNASLIFVGQQLLVSDAGESLVSESEQPQAQSQPAAQVKSYTVQSGDTLFRIASQFGKTVSEIAELNDITNPNMIRVGMSLIIS